MFLVKSFRSWTVCLVLLSVYFSIGLSAASGADERGIWAIWKKQKESPDKHAEIVADCEAFAKASLRDPLVGVADTLCAWHLLSLGRNADAYKILSGYTGRVKTTAMGKGTTIVASAWLSRIDREKIRVALQSYYRREIAYPENLDILAKSKYVTKELAFRPKDRWGNPWNYKLVGFRRLPDMLNQKYKLQITKLGLRSDLAVALKDPYGSTLSVKALQIQPGSKPGAEYFDVAIGGEADEDDIAAGPKTVPKGAKRTVLGEGADKEGVLLAYAGQKILIFCDKEYWQILAKPR